MNGSVFSSGFSATFAFDMNDFSGTLYSEEYNLVANTGGYVGSLITAVQEFTPEVTAAFPAYTSITTMPAPWEPRARP